MCLGTASTNLLDQLDRLIDRFKEEDDAGISSGLMPDRQGEELVRLHGLIERLQAVGLRRVRRFDRDGACHASGALGTAAFLRWKCRMTGNAAAERVRMARRLEELPETSAAFAAGEINLEHVGVITRAADEVGATAAREAEPTLLEVARRHDPRSLRWVTQRLRHCYDPDGCLASSELLHQRRRLHLSQTLEGVYYLDGVLDPESGAMVKTALDALMPPPGRDDVRSASQRRADALMELCRRQLECGQLPGTGGQKPHLTLTLSAETLAGQPGSPPAELDFEQAIPAQTARRLACDCAVWPLVVDENDQPLAVGRAQRTVPGSLRRALVARDRKCAFPDCELPVEWTQAHYLRHWIDGGRTRLKNTLLLCDGHHRAAHEGGVRMVPRDDGRILVLWPGAALADKIPP